MTLKKQLTDFATHIGKNVKTIEKKIETLGQALQALSTQQGSSEVMTQVETKLSEFRQQLFGGNLDEAYDTFKEIGDKLKALDGSIGQAITAKLTEIRQELTTLRTELTELKNQFNDLSAINLVNIYKQAKQGA